MVLSVTCQLVFNSTLEKSSQLMYNSIHGPHTNSNEKNIVLLARHCSVWVELFAMCHT